MGMVSLACKNCYCHIRVLLKPLFAPHDAPVGPSDVNEVCVANGLVRSLAHEVHVADGVFGAQGHAVVSQNPRDDAVKPAPVELPQRPDPLPPEEIEVTTVLAVTWVFRARVRLCSRSLCQSWRDLAPGPDFLGPQVQERQVLHGVRGQHQVLILVVKVHLPVRHHRAEGALPPHGDDIPLAWPFESLQSHWG